MSSPIAGPGYRYLEKLRLYRALMKAAYRFPLKNRRVLVTEEIKHSFRKKENNKLTQKELDYSMILANERVEAIKTYASNMHWFHSRDEVTKEMMSFSEMRDQRRIEENERCNEVGAGQVKTDDVSKFRSNMFHNHPDYYNKFEKMKYTHERDVMKAKGSHGSDMGGPRQKFYVKRYNAHFPQGW
mgnify:CR=1 FL=1